MSSRLQQSESLQLLAVIQSLTMEIDHAYARQQAELVVTYEKLVDRINRAKRTLQQASLSSSSGSGKGGYSSQPPTPQQQGSDAMSLLRQHRLRNAGSDSGSSGFVPSTPPRGPAPMPSAHALSSDSAGTDAEWAMLNETNNSSTSAGTPRQRIHRELTPTGSPQSVEKMPIEELFSRITNASNSPPINFDALYEQLAGKDSPPQHPTSAPADRLSSLLFDDAGHHNNRNNLSIPPPMMNNNSNSSNHHEQYLGSALRRAIPMDSLVSLQGQQQTKDVQVAPTSHEEGLASRPRVIPIPGGESDDDELQEIDANARCQVLVEFKRKRVLQFESRGYVGPGQHVVVGGDRGEDIGLVIYTWCETVTNKVRGIGLTGSSLTRSIGVGTGTVLRIALPHEVVGLYGAQTELERRAVDVCMQRVLEHGLPMVIVDAEYQFDKKKLTFFYEAQQRMDFRDLVRDLFKTFRARIWMELVEN